MKITSFFILLLTIISVQGQEAISGKILDEIGMPIAYANIYLPDTQIGGLSKPDGSFEITIPDSLSQSVLEIVYLGYVKESFKVNELKGNKNEIVLRPLDMNLAEIIVRPKQFKTIIVGNEDKKSDFGIGRSFYSWDYIFRMALFVPNDDNKEGLIESASFFIAKNFNVKKGHQAPFRVRVYDVKEDGSPDNDLLLDNLVSQAKKKNKWQVVDLSKYKIPIPKNGFFIAMEWLYSEDDAYQKEIEFTITQKDGTITREKRIAYGQILGLKKSNDAEENTTIWQSRGDQWTKGFCTKDDPSSNYKGHCNDVMINVQLQIQE